MPNPSSKNVFLIINQQLTPLTRDVTRFGRQLDNDIVLQDESISRHHAEICLEDGQYILVDKQSSSGTFLNGRRIQRCALNSGDLISLSDIPIMFVNNNPKIADHSSLATGSLAGKSDRKDGSGGN